MSLPNIVIELSLTRLGVTVLSGRAVVATGETLFPQSLADLSPASLASVHARLTALLRDLSAPRGNALVLTSGPGTSTAIHSCPATISAGAAIQATRLALESGGEFELDLHPHAEALLRVDRATPNQPAASQFYLVGYAADNTLVAAIEQLITTAGLTSAGTLPREAVRIAEAVASDVSRKEQTADTALRAVLHLDRDGSVLTASQGSRLLLVRPIALGLDAITESLMRPIRGAADAEPITLTRHQAEELLFSIGIPRPDQSIEQTPSLPALRGTSLLPLLQPVLQRIAIETKQSLRFGLSEADRANISLEVRSHSGSVPRLQEALAAHAGVTPHSESIAASPVQPFAVVAASSTLARHTLSSIQRQERQFRLRVRSAAIVGAALACASVAFDAWTSRASLHSAQQQLTATASAATQAEVTAEARDKAIAARIEIERVTTRIRNTMGSQADWPAFLALLSQSLPPEVKLDQISGTTTKDTVTVRVTGKVSSTNNGNASERVGDIINRLKQSPIIASISLGSTSRVRINDSESLSFELVADLVALPAAHFAPAHPQPSPLAAATEANP